jgi:hypothetical protein
MTDCGQSKHCYEVSMFDISLQRIGLLVAIASGAIALLGPSLEWLRLTIFPALMLSAGMVLILFLRMLFDRRIPDALSIAHVKMYGDGASPDRRIKLGDPEWGLLGKAVGSPLLIWTRAILVVGVIPLMFVHQWIGTQGYLLWFCGAFLSMELSVFHVALSQLNKH